MAHRSARRAAGRTPAGDRSASGVALLLALLAAGPVGQPTGAHAAPVGDLPRAADEEALSRGEAVVRLRPLEGSRHSEGLALRVLAGDAERIWRAVADLDHWHEWVPYLEVSEPVPAGGGRRSWQLRFDFPLPLRDRHYRVTAAADLGTRSGAAPGAGATLAWQSLPGSGNVAWARGSVTITPRGRGGALVEFRTATDTGDATPGFLLDRALLESLPWVLDGLAQQVNRCRYTTPWPDGCREAPPSAPP